MFFFFFFFFFLFFFFFFCFFFCFFVFFLCVCFYMVFIVVYLFSCFLHFGSSFLLVVSFVVNLVYFFRKMEIITTLQPVRTAREVCKSRCLNLR